MDDFISAMANPPPLSEEQQKKAGQATGHDMSEEHKKFLKELISMLDAKDLDVMTPDSFLKQENYKKLKETDRAAVDFALINLADQLRHIEEYFRSEKTPNASPQLQTMIEHFWDMTRRLEEKYGDVLKF